MKADTVGEALVTELRARDVSCVFGIPGVHTVELYRGLAASGIRHVTPRHEQGAGFMADGYARVSGKPGVAFVITGPGITNTLTAMAQARADSVPMLVVSGVNASETLGKGLGYLHELPDQHALVETVALVSEHVSQPNELAGAIERAFVPFAIGRPGPTHIQVPLDVAGRPSEAAISGLQPAEPEIDIALVEQVADWLGSANKVVILAGGGAKSADDALTLLAEQLDAPVVQTTNARGLMHAHPLTVPASPSLSAVRELISGADCVLALGTELGPTDYDMYDTGRMMDMANLIRVDICAKQLERHPALLKIPARVDRFLSTLLGLLPPVPKRGDGADRAARIRAAAFEEIGPDYRRQVEILDAMRAAVPNTVMVGDSTQPIYAGNLFYDHDRPGGWFNASTGYGALGYGIPAAIGAAIADPSAHVICIVGDGGAQFSLPEIMAAVDEKLHITFVLWNNRGYGEISSSMAVAGVEIVGCDPTPPNFSATATSYGIAYSRVPMDPSAVARALQNFHARGMPAILEIDVAMSGPDQE